MSKSLHDREGTFFSPLLFDSQGSMSHSSAPVEHQPHFLGSCDTGSNVTETGDCACSQSTPMTTLSSANISRAKSTEQLGSHLQPGSPQSASIHQVCPMWLTNKDPLQSQSFDVAVRSTTTKTTSTLPVPIPIRAPFLLHSPCSVGIATSDTETYSTDTVHRSNVVTVHQVNCRSDNTFAEANQLQPAISTTAATVPQCCTSTTAGISCSWFYKQMQQERKRRGACLLLLHFSPSLSPCLSFPGNSHTIQR